MRTRGAAAILVAGVALAVGGCLPAAQTEEGGQVEGLYRVFMVGALLVGGLVWGLATWALVRYRRRPHDAALPRQVAGSLRLELVWTALPLLAVAGLFGVTLATMSATESAAEPAGVEVRVTGFRWGWTFAYPASGVVVSGALATNPELVVPAGETVRVTLTSADVQHAFFVPDFLFKRDAIPGRETSFDLVVTKPGTYAGACAEFCGVFHDRMPFRVTALSPAEFDRWLAQQAASDGALGIPRPAGAAREPSRRAAPGARPPSPTPRPGAAETTP